MTTTTKTTFADLLTAVARDPKDGGALLELSTAIAYSVLKKCVDVSDNSALRQARRDLTAALHNISGIDYTSAAAYVGTYTADGDYKTETADPTAAAALATLTRETLGGGLDLVNVAAVAILEELKAQKERDPDLPHDLERVYTVRRLSRKVWIKSADSANGWQTVETSPIKEAFKSVRRYISTTAAAVSTDPANGYTYIADLSTDPDGDGESTIYRRLSKYANLGGCVTDFNGALTAYTADPETVKDCDIIIDDLGLTPRQKKILDLRLSGYGCKAIASYLGVTPQSVQTAMQCIQKKAIDALDLTAEDVKRLTAAHVNREKMTAADRQKAAEMVSGGMSQAAVARHFNVSKMTISRIVRNTK